MLRGEELGNLPVIEDAYLVVEDEVIADFGSMKNFTKSYPDDETLIGAILPCWCDSHTHLVFAGSRETEFIGKLKGMKYAEIAANVRNIL